VQRRLLRLLGLARWPMQYLMRHPGVIDELADERLLRGRFDRAAFIAELQSRHAAWARSGEADEEWLLDTLRHAHHAEVFRTLVRDVEGELTVEQVADDLSALADAVLDTTLRWAWALLKPAPPRGAELRRHRLRQARRQGARLRRRSGRGVPVRRCRRARPDRAPEVYGAFVRKLITWLTLRTAAGELFDIDTALRPNGNSGLLVTSIDASSATSSAAAATPPGPGSTRRSRARASAAGAPALASASRPRRGVLTRAARRCGAARGGALDAREGAQRRARCAAAASTSSTAPAA
jgi:glutamate-ammonia-ligase adenylyltransferase